MASGQEADVSQDWPLDLGNQLFDDSPYLREEAMGERPAMSAQEWLEIADQMHDEGNWDAMDFAYGKYERTILHNRGIDNYARMLHEAVEAGEIDIRQAEQALERYVEDTT